MLLNDEEIQERLESPLNLLNRLRNVTSPKGNTSGIPSLPPTSKDLDLDKEIDTKIAVGKLRETAAGVMATALNELRVQMPNVQKPEKLAQIATEMNKILNNTSDKDKPASSQIIVYAPQVIQENHFQELVLENDQ